MTAGAARLAEPRREHEGRQRDTPGGWDARPARRPGTVIELPTALPVAGTGLGAALPRQRTPRENRVAACRDRATGHGAEGHGAEGRRDLAAGHHPAGAEPVGLALPGGSTAMRDRRPARGAAPVVLTRRGRVVMTGLLALMAAGLLAMLPRHADATGAGVSPGRVEQNLAQVAVRPGDTLWSIAVRTDPGADPRLVIQRITDLNALAGAGITPGQTLWVPKS